MEPHLCLHVEPEVERAVFHRTWSWTWCLGRSCKACCKKHSPGSLIMSSWSVKQSSGETGFLDIGSISALLVPSMTISTHLFNIWGSDTFRYPHEYPKVSMDIQRFGSPDAVSLYSFWATLAWSKTQGLILHTIFSSARKVWKVENLLWKSSRDYKTFTRQFMSGLCWLGFHEQSVSSWSALFLARTSSFNKACIQFSPQIHWRCQWPLDIMDIHGYLFFLSFLDIHISMDIQRYPWISKGSDPQIHRGRCEHVMLWLLMSDSKFKIQQYMKSPRRWKHRVAGAWIWRSTNVSEQITLYGMWNCVVLANLYWQ